MCVQFPRDRELLPSLNENNNRCTKVRNNGERGGILKECERTSKKRSSDGTFKKYISFKRSKRGYQTYRSIRKQILFFSYLDSNNSCHGNYLSLTEIMELVRHRTRLVPVHRVVQFTGRSKSAVVDWFDSRRDVATCKFDKPYQNRAEKM